MRTGFVKVTVTLVLGIVIAGSGALGLGSTASAAGESRGPDRATDNVRVRPNAAWQAVEGAVLVATPAAPRRSTETPLRVLLMGDSLVSESGGNFESAIAAEGRGIVDRSLVYGGTAICDFVPRLEAKVAQFRPEVAVVEFSGNSLTACMHDPATGGRYSGDAKVEKYRQDAAATMDVFTRYGVEVYWIGSPVIRTSSERPLIDVYAALPWTWPNAHYFDAGSAVLDRGVYSDYLPCLPVDPCTDVDPATGQPAAKVRAPDGGHFCPVGPEAVRGVTNECPVWSSGAYRFGTAMAAPVINDYGLAENPMPGLI